MEINNKFASRVADMIHLTAQAIGHDAMPYCDDNEAFIESVITNADFYGEDPEAYQVLKETIRENGYHKVLKFLSEAFPYV